MALVFTVQNDAGQIAGANSYLTLAAFKQYQDNQGNDYTTPGYSDPQLQQAIVRATTYLDTRFDFNGKKLVTKDKKAQGTFVMLPVPANFVDGDTITIGSTTYTFQASLTQVQGNVHLGADALASLSNLQGAINACGGNPGVDYFLNETPDPAVRVKSVSLGGMVVQSFNVGSEANAITLSTTSAAGAWMWPNLIGGAQMHTTEWPRQTSGQGFWPWFDINFLTPIVDVTSGPEGFVALVGPNAEAILGIPPAVKNACAEYGWIALGIPLYQNAPAPVGGKPLKSQTNALDVIKQATEWFPTQSGGFVMPAYPQADLMLARAGLINASRVILR